ncbi:MULTISPECIES: hypothetical protein [unclassified Cryobacterium]|uniref:hypothetical protein n=1 Tax=unclassified Cryobacterium TaxID=2649013 RepID=UPI001447A687
MSEHVESRPSGEGSPRKSVALRFLVGLLFLECVMLAAAAVFLLFELLTERPASYASAVAILVLTLIAAIWLAFTAVSTLRGHAWVRGAIVVWQVLQLGLAIGSFQGLFARPDIGWLLAIPAVLVLVLLFTKSVMAATARRDA